MWLKPMGNGKTVWMSNKVDYGVFRTCEPRLANIIFASVLVLSPTFSVFDNTYLVNVLSLDSPVVKM